MNGKEIDAPVDAQAAENGNSSPQPVDIQVVEEERRAYATIKKTGPLVTASDVVAALLAENVPYWIDEKAIEHQIEKGLFDAPFVAAYAKDGEVEIKADKNGMAAHLVLKKAYGGKEINFDDVKYEIGRQDIVFGVNLEIVRLAIQDRSYDISILFAKGKEPVHGTDARIELTFPTEFKIEPKVLEHDKVDYKELQMVYAVEKGTILARKIPLTTGEAGCTIMGKTIPAKPGRDVSLTAGRNAVVEADELTITAAIDGQPSMKGKAVFVEPVYVVQGDVNYSVGNINFKGSVKITGSVLSGFTVKATENIEIDGVVEDCLIEAGRDMNIKGGVLGADEGIIKAGRDAALFFVENCHVEAGRNITIGDCLNSELSAGDTIDAILGQGRIFGGKLSARNLITSNILGSGAADKTQISVGFEPKTVEKIKNLKEVLAKVTYTSEEIEKHIKTLDNMKAVNPLPEDKEVLYKRLHVTRDELSHNIEELKEDISMLENTMTKAVEPLVKIRKTCFPNVRIKIGRLFFDCYEEYHSAVFYEEEEQIKVNVYESFA